MTTTKKTRKPRKKTVVGLTDRDIDVGFKPLRPINQAQFFQSLLAADRNNAMLNSLRASQERYKEDIDTAKKQNAILSADVEQLKSVSIPPKGSKQESVSIAAPQDGSKEFFTPAAETTNYASKIRSVIRDSKQNKTYLEEDILAMSRANLSDIDVALTTPFAPSASKNAPSGRRIINQNRRPNPTAAIIRQQQSSSDELTGKSQLVSRDAVLRQSAAESVDLRNTSLNAYRQLAVDEEDRLLYD
jgi:hypothetical protein